MEAKQQELAVGHRAEQLSSFMALPDEQLSLDTSAKQTEFLSMFRQLQSDLAEKTTECCLLRIKLDESYGRTEALANELNKCKLTMFQDNEDSKKSQEEGLKSKKLEEDYVNLMNSYLELEERYEQHRQNLYGNYIAKTNAINNYECLMSRESLKHELEERKLELHQRQADLNLVSAKLRNMEEENATKEKCITELKKSLDDAKVTHKHEITVLEEYIQCLKNTITSYEKTLANYLDGPNNKDKKDVDAGHESKNLVSTET